MQFYKPSVRGFGCPKWKAGRNAFGHYFTVSSFEFEAIANRLTHSMSVKKSHLRQQFHQSTKNMELSTQNRFTKQKNMYITTGKNNAFFGKYLY
jgi:hypothetical protein